MPTMSYRHVRMCIFQCICNSEHPWDLFKAWEVSCRQKGELAVVWSAGIGWTVAAHVMPTCRKFMDFKFKVELQFSWGCLHCSWHCHSLGLMGGTFGFSILLKIFNEKLLEGWQVTGVLEPLWSKRSRVCLVSFPPTNRGRWYKACSGLPATPRSHLKVNLPFAIYCLFKSI